MNLARYSHFLGCMRSDIYIRRQKCQEIKAFRNFENKWYENDRLEPLEEFAEGNVLSGVLNAGGTKLEGAKALIGLSDLDSVVVCTFTGNPSESEKQDCIYSIQQCAKNASYEFDATHDRLTGLLNRVGMNQAIQPILRSAEAKPSSTEIASSGTKQNIALIVGDIDHFKQVNDTFGHQYGDAVLRAFAWQLEDHAKRLIIESRVKVTIARPGGEEFEILVHDLQDPDNAPQIAESFRKAVSDFLPSAEQEKVIAKDLVLDVAAWPDISRRKITASFGLVLLTKEVGSPEEIYSQLKTRADVALYRAKADGRDRVRNYADIRQQYGRVYRHLQNQDVVVIDIGSDVGVRLNDSYDVYLPDFSGAVPISDNDGRSTKTLGKLPALAAGRIIVFDVQRSISVCQIVSRRSENPFQEQSRLRRVPLGLTCILLPQPIPSELAYLLSPIDFAEQLGQVLRSDEEFIVGMFGILDSAAEAESDDPPTPVRLLTQLSHHLRTTLPPRTILGYFDEFRVVALMFQRSLEGREWNDWFSEATVLPDQKLKVHAGFYAPNVDYWDEKPDKERPKWATPDVLPKRLQPSDAMYLARVAFVAARFPAEEDESNPTFLYFDQEVAATALARVRTLIWVEDAITDYHKLRALGFEGPSLSNQGGISLLEAWTPENTKAAVSAFELAVLQNTGKDQYIPLNLAIAQTAAAQYTKAAATFTANEGPLMAEREKLPPIYFLAYAKALLEVKKANPAAVDDAKLVAALDFALKLPRLNRRIEFQWVRELAAAKHEPASA